MKDPYQRYHEYLLKKTREKEEEFSSLFFQKFADEAIDILKSLCNEREYLLSEKIN